MRTVVHSQYTREGTLRHQIFENAVTAGAETEDREDAAALARALYHRLVGPARLLHYNGDTGVETVMEEKR